MADGSLREPRSYAATTVAGSAAAHLGDQNNYYSAKYNIQHASFNFSDDNTHVRIPFQALTKRSHLGNDARSGKGLALLSFDGGLDGGLSSLYMLNHFMERVGQAQRLKHPPKPYEFFDIIGGAGIGGLLAVLLGRLELSINECIEKYIYLNQAIFESKPVSTAQRNAGEDTEGEANLNPMIIEAAMKQILKDCGQDEDKHLETSSAISCKVFIKASTSKVNVIFRSYKVHQPEDSRFSQIKIWQVVQATLAAAGLLDTVEIRHSQYEGTYRASTKLELSTVSDLWAEAQKILIDGDQKLEDHLDCLVSIGTNFAKSGDGKGTLDGNLHTLTSTSSPIRAAYDDFSRSHRRLVSSNKICRLELQTEFDTSSNWEHGKYLHIQAAVEHHLATKSISDYIVKCVNEASSHQIDPGFALLRVHEQPLVLSGQRKSRHLPSLISDYDARTAHWRRSHSRIKGTCTWIFKNAAFNRWRQTPGTSVLWCVGTVGCGKSFLAAAVIDHMREIDLGPTDACIQYFFETGHNTTRSLDDMLRTMVKQLLLSSQRASIALPSQVHQALHDMFNTRKVLPTTDELTTLLKEMVDIFPRTLYLIDGFDDLNETQIQDFFAILRRIFVVGNPHGSKLALFSRKSLGRGLNVSEQLAPIPAKEGIRLTLKFLWPDIAKFVNVQVDDQQLRRKITINEDLIPEIKKKLKKNSDKMFLWLYFQIKSIWDSSLSINDDHILKLISNLPKGLDETYVNCLRRIEQNQNTLQQTVAVKAFRWSALAKRALTPRQAREVVSIDPQNIQVQESQILNTSVIDYCANLLTTDITNQCVQFTHASVKQFLSDKSKLPPDLFKYHIQPEEDNQSAIAMCFAYIVMLQSRKQVVVRHKTNLPANVTKTFLQNMASKSTIGLITKVLTKKSASPSRTVALPVPAPAPRYLRLDMHEYFLKFWLPHCSEININDPHYPLFRKLCLSPNSELFPWLESCTVDVGLFQQLIHYAVLERHPPLLRVLRDYLAEQKSYMVLKAFNNGCPGTSIGFLHIAAALGYKEIIAELRNVCAINEPDTDGKTPLAWAAENSRHEVVEYLVVEAQADITACRFVLSGDAAEGVATAGTMNRISLMAVLAGLDNPEGFWHFLRLGLSSYRQCLTKERISQALFAACTKGHCDIAMQLQELGADLNYFSEFPWPGSYKGVSGRPLLAALRFEDSRAVETLLKIGAFVNKDSEELLSWAAKNGHEAVVELLLEKGADLESRNNIGRTPLSLAAEKGHEATVKLLLEKGANLESIDHIGRTPLSLAVEKGCKAVVELLLDKGANIELRDKQYDRTPLLWAAVKGHEAVVELLLEKGASLESRDKVYGWTPLSWAAWHGHEAVVKLIRSRTQ